MAGNVAKPIGTAGAAGVVAAVVNATRSAHLAWKLGARFQGITVNGPTAVGGPGCLTGPDLGGLILSQPQIVTLKGDDRVIADAAVKGIGDKFKAWQSGVTVPGLPWYPPFAAFPAPQAPPTPNVPTTLLALASSGAGGIMNASSLQGAMSAHLDPQFKARDATHGQIFGAIAVQVAGYFAAWLGAQVVANVMGHGPIPTFAPPFVPVGPVLNGSVISGGGHLP